jgi:hypothetical protein
MHKQQQQQEQNEHMSKDEQESTMYMPNGTAERRKRSVSQSAVVLIH